MRKLGGSKNVLIHQIDNQSYQKSLLGQMCDKPGISGSPKMDGFRRARTRWNRREVATEPPPTTAMRMFSLAVRLFH